METQTLVAIVGVTGALIGSAVGGLISFFSSRSVRRLEWGLGLAEKELRARESLYAEFLTEANRLLLHQIEGKSHQATEMASIIGLESRIWFYSDEVAKVAREIVLCVLDGNIKDSEKKEGKDKLVFGDLKDSFLSECKKDFARVKSNA